MYCPFCYPWLNSPNSKILKHSKMGLLMEFFGFFAFFIPSFPCPLGIVRSSVLRARLSWAGRAVKILSRRICSHSFSFTITPRPLTRVGPWNPHLWSSSKGNPFWPAFPLLPCISSSWILYYYPIQTFLFPFVAHAGLCKADVSTVHTMGVLMDGWMVLLNEITLMQLLMDKINSSFHFGQG